MGNNYSSYVKDAPKLQSNMCVIYAVPSMLYGINLPQEIIDGIQNVYVDVWGQPFRKVKYYNANLTKFQPHKSMMYQCANATNSALAKKMFVRFHRLFCSHGWSLANSPTLTFEHSLSSWFFYKEISPYMVHTGSVDNEFCAISLSGIDSLQFIDFPKNLEDSITNIVSQYWHKGIQEKGLIEKLTKDWKIKLHGTPWGPFGSGETALEARLLVLCIIRLMSHNNWRLINSTAMKTDASDTLFFRKLSNAFNTECPDTMPEYYFMLALMNKNYFSIICGDAHIKQTIASACSKYEEKGIQPEDMKHNYPAVILNSKVWSRRGEKALKTRRLMALLFQDLATIGWLPTESVDCSRSIRDLSSIVFVRIPPMRMMCFCLCPKKFHGISIVNAPDDVIQVIHSTFIQYYPIEKHNVTLSTYGIGTAIEFTSDPFTGRNRWGIILFQQTLSVIISALNDFGWVVMMSADTSDETLVRSTGSDSYEEIKYSIHGLWFSKFIA